MLRSATASRIGLGVVAVIFLAHAVGLAATFDPWTALWDDQPWHAQDWGFHFNHVKSMEGYLEQGRLWGYNPYFMAGYPSNTIQDASIKFFELAASLTPGLDMVRAFKLWIVVGTLAVPWMVYLTFVLLFGEHRSAAAGGAVASALATAHWWGSFPREMFFFGMVGFPLAAYLGWLILALLYRMLSGSGRWLRWWLGWVAGSAVLLPLHVLGTVVVAVPGAAFWTARVREESARRALWLAGGLLLALAFNAVWLVPFATHWDDQLSSEMVLALPLFTSTDLLTFVKDYFTYASFWTNRVSRWEKVPRAVLLVVGITGLWLMARRERPDLTILMIVAGAWTFFLTYFAFLIPPMRGWQLLRFKVPLDVLLALAAAYAVMTIWRDRIGGAAGKPAVAGILAVALAGWGLSVVRTEAAEDWRLHTEVRSPAAEILDWLQTRASRDGRVLFEETGDETGFRYDGRYLSPFLAHWTGHQFIGGPINLTLDRHHFAEFHSGYLMKRDIAGMSDVELLAYLRLYNIGSVVAFVPRSVNRLLAMGGVVSVDRVVDGIHLMRVNLGLTWFLKGRGSARAALNEIRCADVSGTEVILKYHWVEGLRSEPPIRMEPVTVLDDPIPFIRLIDPPASFRLFVGR